MKVRSTDRYCGWRPVGLLALTMAMFAGCKRESAMTMPTRPPARVTVAPAIERDVPLYLDAIGKAVTVESVSVIPQVGGRIVTAPVEDGAMVKKGDLLFEIDPRPFEATLAAAQATLQQANAEHDLAVTEFERVKNVTMKGAVSQQELAKRQNDVVMAEAHIAAAKASIESAKLNLEYTRIYSPLNGRAGVRMVDPGNVVVANGQPMLLIQQMDPIFAEFTITENDLGTVRKYMAEHGLDLNQQRNLRVSVELPANSARVLAALSGAPATSRPTTTVAPREGKVVFLDNTVQTNSGTIRLRAELPNPDAYFWPGQFVNVRLVLATRPHAVLVPAQAEQIGQQGPYVYVVESDSTAKLHPIVVGQRHGDMLVVEQGIDAGEQVVVTGQLAVVPDSKVQIVTDGAKPAVEATTTAGAMK